MYITYHKEIEKPENVQDTIPYIILSEELKAFLKENNAVQNRYYFDDNNFYWFLYLKDGDRIDVKLN